MFFCERVTDRTEESDFEGKEFGISGMWVCVLL
jgi:hypothetical protein